METEKNISKETISEIDAAREIEDVKKIEAALFISGKFLSMQELVSLTDINPILLQDYLEKLSQIYDETRAMEIVNQNDLWKMDVRQEHREIVNKIATGNEEFTDAEQKTLAVIAYKQPITQAKVISMRGNKAYDHIKKLSDLGLIKSKKAGRTLELSLSTDFYDYFNLKDENILKKPDKE
jgi:segregation and condensation protein B